MEATVVLIEDDLRVLDASHYFLESFGYQVMVATTGGRARKLLRETGALPNVIVTDYRLP
jgi:DNA-binding response OmpR family regulator